MNRGDLFRFGGEIVDFRQIVDSPVGTPEKFGKENIGPVFQGNDPDLLVGKDEILSAHRHGRFDVFQFLLIVSCEKYWKKTL